MKDQANLSSYGDLVLEQLQETEMAELNGGIVPAMVIAFGLLGGVALLAYGAGYAYGKIIC